MVDPAAILGLKDSARAEELRIQVAEVRELYIAVIEGGKALPLCPAITLRKLEGIYRALARDVRPRKRALDDPGVRWALAQAGVNFAEGMFAEGKLAAKGHRGSRGKARELIDREEAGQARTLALKAIEVIRCLKGRRRGRLAEEATTKAVRRLGLLYWLATAKPPTRGGRKSPSQFELFLEAAIGDLVGAKARALGKRWQRAEASRRAAVKAAELDGQNIAGEPTPESEKA